jgi:hypothetical protein
MHAYSQLPMPGLLQRRYLGAESHTIYVRTSRSISKPFGGVLMRFGERVVVVIFRPIYRTFFDRLFWWFLEKVKVFLLGDIAVQLQNMEQRLVTAQSESQQRWAAMEEQLRNAQASNAEQWNALEELLLALFRQPALLVSGTDLRHDTPE